MYDQVVDTRKQLESLKHLLLKDITDDEKVTLDTIFRGGCVTSREI